MVTLRNSYRYGLALALMALLLAPPAAADRWQNRDQFQLHYSDPFFSLSYSTGTRYAKPGYPVHRQRHWRGRHRSYGWDYGHHKQQRHPGLWNKPHRAGKSYRSPFRGRWHSSYKRSWQQSRFDHFNRSRSHRPAYASGRGSGRHSAVGPGRHGRGQRH